MKVTTGKVHGSSFAHNDILAASDSLYSYACLPSLPWQLLLSMLKMDCGTLLYHLGLVLQTVVVVRLNPPNDKERKGKVRNMNNFLPCVWY